LHDANRRPNSICSDPGTFQIVYAKSPKGSPTRTTPQKSACAQAHSVFEFEPGRIVSPYFDSSGHGSQFRFLPDLENPVPQRASRQEPTWACFPLPTGCASGPHWRGSSAPVLYIGRIYRTNSGLTVPFAETSGTQYVGFPLILTLRTILTRRFAMPKIMEQEKGNFPLKVRAGLPTCRSNAA
jgi:hypothetical protein